MGKIILNTTMVDYVPEQRFNPIAISRTELANAKATPRVLVKNLLYADVRFRIAAGGVGKTTLLLYEAARLAVGKPIWGNLPVGQIRTCIVTREDCREILVARLREVMTDFSDKEINQALENIRIVDVSNESFRLSRIAGDLVEPDTENINDFCNAVAPFRPDWVVFDPVVSFGIGESRVNDAEQGIVEAFRIIRNRLNCCVEGIHHSGKANAREKTLDQYSGRGGSAMADGSRMMAVIQPLDENEWLKQTGTRLDSGESGLVMALPKLSYAPPQESIFIRRHKFYFSHENASRATPDQVARLNAQAVMDFIHDEWQAGRRYSKADLEAQKDRFSLTRGEVRLALSELSVTGKVFYHETRGKTGSHYQPLTFAEVGGETSTESST